MTQPFPIDYVVPMVFPDDPQWQRDLRSAGGDLWRDNAVRYRSWGTEQLLIQCIRTFLPWVRTIYIILARESQVQPWMTATVPDVSPSGLKVVFHRDFIPAEFLPTFNSRAIEMFLDRIPGLSDHFLYANDDMIPVAPLAVTDFFRQAPVPAASPAGLTAPSGSPAWFPCQHMEPKDFPACPNNFQVACLGGLNFVAEEFGLTFTNKWMKNGHSIAPILRQTCRHLWQRGADRIMASISPFREPKNFNQYIYSWYQHLSGQYIDHTPVCSLQKAHTDTPAQMAAAILDPQNQIVCINDHEDCRDITVHREMVCDAINRRLHTALAGSPSETPARTAPVPASPAE